MTEFKGSSSPVKPDLVNSEKDTNDSLEDVDKSSFDGDNEKQDNKKGNFLLKALKILILFISSVAVVYLAIMILFPKGESANKVSWSALQTKIEKNEIKSLTVQPTSQTVNAVDKKNKSFKIGIPTSEGKSGLGAIISLAKKHNVVVKSEPVSSGKGLFAYLFSIVPFLLLVGIIGFFAYSQGMIGNKVEIEPISSGVGFDGVAGCGEAIEELQEIRQFLRSPEKFESLGASVPKGVLLYGPPGTGKTLLAKAVANEANIPFFACAGSDFVEMYAGLGAKRVRSIFKKAKEAAPSILFIDELDAVGSSRGGSNDGASREADQTLMEILRQMDGFSVNQNPIIVIAATNRIEVLDRALTRPGRFDRHIAVDPPDRKGREEVLRVHAKNKKLSDDIDLKKIALHTSGMTGADLALLLNEAALLTARRNGNEIKEEDIDGAFLRILVGAEKQHRSFSEEEREKVAYHESGHAIVKEVLGGADLVHKISIIPRGQSGGQTIYVSDKDVFLHSEQHLKDMIASTLAGRAAEEIVFNEISSGASDDLQKTSDIASQMYSKLGMGKTLGLRVSTEHHPLSDIEQHELDEEIKELLKEEYERAKKIIVENKDSLISVAKELLKDETIDRERFLEIIDLNI